jgi:hypothetical protein
MRYCLIVARRFARFSRIARWLAPVVGFAALVVVAGGAEISLNGVIDLHCHAAPDTVARSAGSLDVVRQAREAGMRALVLKNHFLPTAAIAQIAMQEVGGIEVFGGIVLNRSVGGINAEAVRRMVQVEGRRGKIVWLPTFDAENQVRFSREQRQFVPVVKDGRPVPELAEVFRIAAEADLVLATGHSSPAESLMVLDAARKAGVKRLLVTHVLGESTRASIDQMKGMAALGALMELTWLAHLGGTSGPVAGGVPTRGLAVSAAVEAIRAVGAEHFVLTSDLGQAGNPSHTEGLRTFIAALMAEGVTAADVGLMTRENPARVLGLDR